MLEARDKRFLALVVVSLFTLLLFWVGDHAAIAAKTTTYRGTPHRDVIRTGNGGWQVTYGRGGNDSLHGGRGTDLIHGNAGNDAIWTGSGGAKEAAWGGRGNDRINDWASGESPGYLNGGPGHDVCIGDKHDVFISCEVIRWK